MTTVGACRAGGVLLPAGWADAEANRHSPTAQRAKARSIRVIDKIGFSNHPMLAHFKFLKAHTKVMPKMTIPSPSVLHFRLEPGAVAKSAYRDRDAIFDR